MKLLILSILLTAGFVAHAEVKSQTYQITIESNWSEQDHLGLPPSAHFSPVVAVAHTSDYDLLPIGSFTGPGLEMVAELGNTRVIEPEINEAQNEGSVDQLVITENQFVLRKPVQTLEITVTNKHPFLSFVSMIAPSPDWVIGVSNLKLYSENAGFYAGISSPMPLLAIDAGTESRDFGGNFSINNPAQEPRQPIQFLTGRGFDVPFAFVTITPID